MKKNILPLAKQLITIPSITGDLEKNFEIIKFVKNELQEFVFIPFVSNNIPSLLYNNKQEKLKKFKILFNLHLDVVPGAPETFIPRIEGNRLYGRGAYDMKAAAAAIIMLYKELAPTLPYACGLQITTDEEIGGEDGTKYQLQNGVRADFAITGESGSNLGITHESKARIVMQLIAKGKTSHSGYPWLGENAIVKLQQALHEVITHYPLPQEQSYTSTINITHVSTNNTEKSLTGYNRTPNYCEALLDIRVIPADIDRLLPQIQSLVAPYVETKILHNSTPHNTPQENHYIQQLQVIGKQIRGEEFPYIKAHATSDIRHISEVKGHGIEFGPVGGNAHQENEWVDIRSLEEYYQILKAFLLSIK